MGAILTGPTGRKSTGVRRNQKYFTYIDGRRNSRREERARKGVRELKNRKSCGPEEVCAEMLKHGTDILKKELTWIINRWLNGEKICSNEKLHSLHKYTKKEAKSLF